MPSNQRQIIKQAKFIYSLWGKVLGKQTEKNVGVLKSLHFKKKKKKEIVKLQNVIKKDNLNCKRKPEKT